MALVTNGLTEVQNPRIERVGLRELFATIVVSSEVSLAKPDPAFFELVLARLGDPPRDTVLIVGDSLSSDMAGGIAAGIATCWFNPGRRPRPRGLALSHEIAALSELPALV